MQLCSWHQCQVGPGVIMYCKLAIIWVMLWDTFEPYVLCRLCHEVERTGWRVGETLLENCWSFVANFFVFYDWEKTFCAIKGRCHVVVLSWPIKAFFLQQNWHMQLLRVCKQTTNEKQPTRFRANFTIGLVCKVRTFWEAHIIWKKSSSWFWCLLLWPAK